MLACQVSSLLSQHIRSHDDLLGGHRVVAAISKEVDHGSIQAAFSFGELGNRTRTFLSGSVLCKTSANTHASSEPRSANQQPDYYVECHQADGLAIKGLGRLTAHSYCLRIINHCRAHVVVTQQFLHRSERIGFLNDLFYGRSYSAGMN